MVNLTSYLNGMIFDQVLDELFEVEAMKAICSYCSKQCKKRDKSKSVQDCDQEECDLYPFRLGRNPFLGEDQKENKED